jgi:hypothetical protein
MERPDFLLLSSRFFTFVTPSEAMEHSRTPHRIPGHGSRAPAQGLAAGSASVRGGILGSRACPWSRRNSSLKEI